LEQFQDKFHFALRTAESFRVENNLLMITFDGGSRDLLFFSDPNTAGF
jgi:hypothetical protein